MNKGFGKLILASALLATAVSCKEDSLEERDPVKVNRSLTVKLESGEWIYYSISNSCVVGKGIVGDSVDDKEWKERNDWDIAISESGIRTNSGTSGIGKGGLAVISNSDFDEESMLPLTTLDYSVDVSGFNAVIPLPE